MPTTITEFKVLDIEMTKQAIIVVGKDNGHVFADVVRRGKSVSEQNRNLQDTISKDLDRDDYAIEGVIIRAVIDTEPEVKVSLFRSTGRMTCWALQGTNWVALPPAATADISKLSSEQRQTLAAGTNAPLATFLALAWDSDDAVRLALARNTRAPSEALRELYQREKDPRIKEAMGTNLLMTIRRN